MTFLKGKNQFIYAEGFENEIIANNSDLLNHFDAMDMHANQLIHELGLDHPGENHDHGDDDQFRQLI